MALAHAHYASDVAGACDRADITLLLTEWQEFIDRNPWISSRSRGQASSYTPVPVSTPQARTADWAFRSMGRCTPSG